MRVTSKGQVTIPLNLRESTGLMPGTEFEFQVEEGAVRLVKSIRDGGRKTRGHKLVDSLRGGGDFKMTTDEIIALMRGPRAEEG